MREPPEAAALKSLDEQDFSANFLPTSRIDQLTGNIALAWYAFERCRSC